MSYRAHRFWWAFMLCALLLAVLGVLIPMWTLSAPGGWSIGNLLWMVGLAFLTLIHIAYFASQGISGASRMRHRRRAIEGDPWAMPESIIEPDAADVFNVSYEPLVLPWKVERPIGAMIALMLAGTGLTFLLGLMLPIVLQHVWGIDIGFTDKLAEGFAASLHSGAIALCVPVIWLLSLFLRGRLTVIEATNDGIRFQPIIGRVRLMRWEHMRLLEVGERERTISKGSKWVTRWYALYDARSRMISWVEWGWRDDMVQPYGITWDDMWALSRELVDVIYQRTGLVPRTFSKSLQRGLAGGRVRTSWEPEEAQEMEVEDARS